MYLVAEAVESSGYQVAIVDMFEYRDPWTVLESKIARFRPYVVGVSIRNIDDQSRENTQFFLEGSREVIRRLRSLTAPGGDALLIVATVPQRIRDWSSKRPELVVP